MFMLMRMIRLMGRLGSIAPLKISIVAILVLLSSASGFISFEKPLHPELTWMDGLWWSFVTMTTVGYGDLYPSTNACRLLVAAPTMLMGIGTLSYLLSAIGVNVFERYGMARRGLMPINCKNHVLVIHYPGEEQMINLITQLNADPITSGKCIVLIDDKLESIPPEIASENVRFVSGVPTKVSVLDKANFREATHAIVHANNDPDPDSRTLSVILMLESAHPEIHSVAECISKEHIHLLKTAGTDRVVCLANLKVNLLVQELIDPGVQDVLSEITSNTVGHGIYMYKINRTSTYGVLRKEFKETQNMIVLGVRDSSAQISLNPSMNMPVAEGEQLVCIAEARPV